MEAGRVPRDPDMGARREADVAPAPDPTGGRSAGMWAPADPGPLGLAAFAGTTFVLSIFNADLVSPHGQGVVLGLTFAYGGLAQLLAGMWEFRTGNTFGAVAFSSFGAFWISFFFLLRLTPAISITTNGLAVYLYMWAIFTTYMFVASLRTTAAVAGVFLLLAITFFILAIGNANLGPRELTNGTIKLGGWFGLATAIVAWYASFAAVVNSTFGRVMLPVVPLRR
ncbi:MAG: acetate uptake transporter [Solirubrobacterales bacterium]|nr:acetate uptake transporter [Solirubrobacterales bacterium]